MEQASKSYEIYRQSSIGIYRDHLGYIAIESFDDPEGDFITISPQSLPAFIAILQKFQKELEQ